MVQNSGETVYSGTFKPVNTPEEICVKEDSAGLPAAVAMVGVGPKPDSHKGEIAKAYIVLKAGASADSAGIIDYCRKHLAAYKVPREVHLRDDLPRNALGKILRRELRPTG